MPLGHLGLNVRDLATAKAYYDKVLPALGYESFLSAEDQFAFKPAAGKHGTYLFFYEAVGTTAYSRESIGLQHLAFIVPSRSDVWAMHALAVELGDEVLFTPQPFPQYPPPYFATFWIDPFGFMLEAVCHYDRD